jgi:hypothetical protein
MKTESANYEEIDNFVSDIHEHWAGDFVNDPSIEAVGQDSWNKQLQAASKELLERTTALVSEIENKLINGEYYYNGYKSSCK